jgi:hypothetical protein
MLAQASHTVLVVVCVYVCMCTCIHEVFFLVNMMDGWCPTSLSTQISEAAEGEEGEEGEVNGDILRLFVSHFRTLVRIYPYWGLACPRQCMLTFRFLLHNLLCFGYSTSVPLFCFLKDLAKSSAQLCLLCFYIIVLLRFPIDCSIVIFMGIRISSVNELLQASVSITSCPKFTI